MIRIAIAMCVMTATATAGGSHCHDSTEIVGYTHCRRYGSWGFDHGATDITLDTGGFLMFQRVVVPESHGTAMSVRLDGARRIRDAVGGGFRSVIGVGDLSVGVEESVVHGIANAGVTSPDLPPFPSSLDVLALHVVVGVRTFALATTLRAELAVGGESSHTSGPCESNTCLATSAGQFSTELRVRADRWISRYVTLGVRVGANVIAIGELSFAIVVTGHDVAYDGW